MNGSRRVMTIAILAAMALQACTLPGAATPTPMLGEPPLGPLSLYLSTGGDDANDCLSEATACRTLYNAFRL